MLRPFLLSFALAGLSAASIGADSVSQNPSDVATWRWSVNTILDAQRNSNGLGATQPGNFGQGYERYSALGQPETSPR
jgi:hypothetical protein